jgi:hypothetical protein
VSGQGYSLHFETGLVQGLTAPGFPLVAIHLRMPTPDRGANLQTVSNVAICHRSGQSPGLSNFEAESAQRIVKSTPC